MMNIVKNSFRHLMYNRREDDRMPLIQNRDSRDIDESVISKEEDETVIFHAYLVHRNVISMDMFEKLHQKYSNNFILEKMLYYFQSLDNKKCMNYRCLQESSKMNGIYKTFERVEKQYLYSRFIYNLTLHSRNYEMYPPTPPNSPVHYV